MGLNVFSCSGQPLDRRGATSDRERTSLALPRLEITTCLLHLPESSLSSLRVSGPHMSRDFGSTLEAAENVPTFDSCLCARLAPSPPLPRYGHFSSLLCCIRPIPDRSEQSLIPTSPSTVAMLAPSPLSSPTQHLLALTAPAPLPTAAPTNIFVPKRRERRDPALAREWAALAPRRDDGLPYAVGCESRFASM